MSDPLSDLAASIRLLTESVDRSSKAFDALRESLDRVFPAQPTPPTIVGTGPPPGSGLPWQGVTERTSIPCPRCNHQVAVGAHDCAVCGHKFDWLDKAKTPTHSFSCPNVKNSAPAKLPSCPLPEEFSALGGRLLPIERIASLWDGAGRIVLNNLVTERDPGEEGLGRIGLDPAFPLGQAGDDLQRLVGMWLVTFAELNGWGIIGRPGFWSEKRSVTE